MISLLLGGVAGDDGDHLDDAELMALCSLILFAGHETTTNLLCNALVALDRHPCRAGPAAGGSVHGQPGGRGGPAVRGPDQIIIRWVVEDHERDGRQVARRATGSSWSSSRPTGMGGTFTDPDRFDITRPTQPLHVGFGRGIHACLGAQLARIEARVALPKVLGGLGRTSGSSAR